MSLCPARAVGRAATVVPAALPAVDSVSVLPVEPTVPATAVELVTVVQAAIAVPTPATASEPVAMAAAATFCFVVSFIWIPFQESDLEGRRFRHCSLPGMSGDQS